MEGIDAFKGMWLLVEGLVQSGRSVVWTGVFTLVILYGFGVVLSTSLGEEAVVFERWENADMYVGSVPRCIFTTLQVFTYDGWFWAHPGCGALAGPTLVPERGRSSRVYCGPSATNSESDPGDFTPDLVEAKPSALGIGMRWSEFDQPVASLRAISGEFGRFRPNLA